MTKTPGPSPEEKTCSRILTLSRLNGWSVVVIAGLGCLLALALGDWSGCGVGLLVLAGGVMEVHGNRRLQQRDATGMRWLVRAELWVLAVILVYCASRLGSFDRDTVMGNLTPDMAAMLNEAGIAQGDLLPLVQLVFYAVYGTVAFVTVIYQGGFALYYRSRMETVTRAFAAAPRSAAQPPLA